VKVRSNLDIVMFKVRDEVVRVFNLEQQRLVLEEFAECRLGSVNAPFIRELVNPSLELVGLYVKVLFFFFFLQT
jgi:hypothetical protein